MVLRRFLPEDPAEKEWVADTADITHYVKNKSGGFTIQFRNINGYGNNIFIDDIHIYSRILPASLKQKGYLISPNPTTDIVNIQHYPSTADLKGVALYSGAGQLIWKRDYRSSLAPDNIQINLRQMASGIYIVRLIYTDRTISQKILKMN